MEHIQRIPMSWDDFLARHDLDRAEWTNGVAIVSPQPRQRHGVVVINLGALLKASLPDAVVLAESGLRMSGSLRGPDVMVVETLTDTAWVEEAPILVVEVLSPSTRSEDLLRKGPEYAEAGIGQFWVVDPDSRTLEVHQLVEGRWEPLLRLDDLRPTGEVMVPAHGRVALDLPDILAG